MYKPNVDLPAEVGGKRYLTRNNTLIMGSYISSVIESQIIDQALYDVQQSNHLRVQYSTEEIARYIGLPLGSAIYSTLHKAVDHLLDCKIVLHDVKNKKTEGFVIVTYCCYNKGILSLEINSHVLPYLINPKPPFTKMDLNDLKKFGEMRKSRNFDLRLYEIISTSLFLIDSKKMTSVERYFSLEELKIRTGLVQEINDQLKEYLDKNGITPAALTIAGDLYPSWGDFKRRVLDPAIVEINKKQSLELSYKTRCAGRGRKVLGLTFCIKRAAESQIADYNEQPGTASENTDLVYTVRNMIPVPLCEKDIKTLISVADGNIDRINDALKHVLEYKARKESEGKKIDNFTGLLRSAIEKPWTAPLITNTPSPKNKKRGLRSSHLEKYGFANNIYDFDELEKEIVSNC